MRSTVNVQTSAARKSIFVLGTLALMACSGNSAASTASTAVIPADFQGNWYEGDDGAPACLPGDNGIVQVEAGEFTYPMAGNTVVAVEPVKLNVIRVTFRQQGVGDGTSASAPRTVTEQWTLSHDEEYLLIENENGSPANGVADLFRCKKAAAAG